MEYFDLGIGVVHSCPFGEVFKLCASSLAQVGLSPVARLLSALGPVREAELIKSAIAGKRFGTLCGLKGLDISNLFVGI